MNLAFRPATFGSNPALTGVPRVESLLPPLNAIPGPILSRLDHGTEVFMGNGGDEFVGGGERKTEWQDHIQNRWPAIKNQWEESTESDKMVDLLTLSVNEYLAMAHMFAYPIGQLYDNLNPDDLPDGIDELPANPLHSVRKYLLYAGTNPNIDAKVEPLFASMQDEIADFESWYHNLVETNQYNRQIVGAGPGKIYRMFRRLNEIFRRLNEIFRKTRSRTVTDPIEKIEGLDQFVKSLATQLLVSSARRTPEDELNDRIDDEQTFIAYCEVALKRFEGRLVELLTDNNAFTEELIRNRRSFAERFTLASLRKLFDECSGQEICRKWKEDGVPISKEMLLGLLNARLDIHRNELQSLTKRLFVYSDNGRHVRFLQNLFPWYHVALNQRHPIILQYKKPNDKAEYELQTYGRIFLWRNEFKLEKMPPGKITWLLSPGMITPHTTSDKAPLAIEIAVEEGKITDVFWEGRAKKI